MGLPSAQLGSLPGLNVPSSVPLAIVPKVPSLWQSALASFLAQTGGAVGTQLVGNAMSRDSAPEFGKTAATGWDKLVHGPEVGDKEAAQLRAEAGDTARNTATITGADTRNKFSEGEATKRNMSDIASRQSEGVLTRTSQASEGKLTREQQLAIVGAETERAKQLAVMEQTFRTPYQAAQIRELGQQGAAEEARGGYHREQAVGQQKTNALIPSPTPTATKGAVDPRVADFAKRQAAPQAVAQAPAPTEESMIQDMLAQGASPDAVVQQMQILKTRQAGVQSAATQRGITDEAQVMQKQAALEEILRRLHPPIDRRQLPGGY